MKWNNPNRSLVPTDHFHLWEFLCPCGQCQPTKEQIENIEMLAHLLDVNFRIPLCVPVVITSGLRCTAHNYSIGGAASSQHLLGNAADIRVSPFSGQWLKGWAESQIKMGALTEGGLGTYAKYPSLLHYDRRGEKARWHK